MMNYSTDVSLKAAGEKYQIATTQTHQTVMGRTSVVRETTLDVFQKRKSKDDYNPAHMLATHEGPMNVNDVDLMGSTSSCNSWSSLGNEHRFKLMYRLWFLCYFL